MTAVLSDAKLNEYIALRRDLHRHPELAFNEQRTSGIVAEKLRSFGLEVHTGIAKTGVVGVLDFGDGPFIGFRADMDALPIEEDTGVLYASQHSGVMHACGHDGHTSMLLAAADQLSQSSNLRGKIAFIFQPAEENEGGARVMVEEGLFERFPVEKIFALHNMPGVPVGTIMARSGYVSAAFDTFDITVEGQGGHGAMPETTRDPVPAASAIVQALNTIISRNIRPFEAGVVTVGQMETSESSYNVIPQSVLIKGSCRSLSADVQKTLKKRISDVCQGIGVAYDVQIDITYEERYPPVFNDDGATALLWEAVSKARDSFTLIKEFEPVMGSEDFAFMSQKVPGHYFIIGNGDGCGPLHSPTYNFNDDALKVGATAFIRLAETLLKACD